MLGVGMGGALDGSKKKTRQAWHDERSSNRVLPARLHWDVRGNDGELDDAPAVDARVWRLGLDPANAHTRT